ncbi:elongation factor G [bacterium]|nr:elongation factor G [bacterium]
MNVPMERLRNIGIIAHIDAGKTTTTERILYFAGTSHKLGEVDDGTTTTDFDPEEAQRGITIYSACVTTTWKNATINIIDTPGHVDFTAEVERALRVLDGAVVIFSAVEGVEAQSETVWRQADHYNVPRICFINKLDRIGADFQRTFDEIQNRLCRSTEIEKHVTAVTVPATLCGELVEFPTDRCIVNLIDRKLLVFGSEDDNWAVSTHEPPESIQDGLEEWRTQLIDTACMFDDAAMEQYFGEGDLSPAELRRTIRIATLSGHVIPVFAGTSLRCVGVQPVLDGIVDFLPSPLDREAVKGFSLSKSGDKVPEKREPSPDEPFCALVFKIVADKHNDLYFARVYSGRVKSGSRMLNPRTDKKEMVTQLWHIQADSRERVDQDEAKAGDIVGIIGLKHSVTGDTLCEQKSPIVLEQIEFPETVISMAVEPETSAEKDKLELTLNRLALQDPTFTASVDPDTGQTLVSGMGELHLEVLKNRMERDFNLKIRVHRPRVTYKETISGPVDVEGRFDKETAAGHNFATVKLSLKPVPDIVGVTITNDLPAQQIPAIHREALLGAVRDEASSGIQGFPLTQLEIHITDFNYLAGATNETAIYAAVANAFQSALQRIQTVVLEPVMKLEISTPEEFVGAIQSDLNSRRAIVTGSEKRGNQHIVLAEAPLAQMFGYTTAIRSISQGRASYSMEPLRYSPAQSLPDYM